MPRMPSFDEIRADFERGVRTAEHAIEHPFRRQPPAPVPATMAPAPAGAATRRRTMSLITDVENGYAAVKTEIAKLEQNLPAALEVAKKLEGNPLVQIAIKGAEHVAAGLLPPEALAYLAGNFGTALDGLLSLYNPQPGAPAAPVQAPAQ